MTYHRLDLRLNKDLRPCLQGKQLISSGNKQIFRFFRVLFMVYFHFQDRCGLYLSPKCFDKPYERSLGPEDLRSAQGYWAYISDHTKLITNPGLKVGHFSSFFVYKFFIYVDFSDGIHSKRNLGLV